MAATSVVSSQSVWGGKAAGRSTDDNCHAQGCQEREDYTSPLVYSKDGDRACYHRVEGWCAGKSEKADHNLIAHPEVTVLDLGSEKFKAKG